jgi:hypothetical protein
MCLTGKSLTSTLVSFFVHHRHLVVDSWWTTSPAEMRCPQLLHAMVTPSGVSDQKPTLTGPQRREPGCLILSGIDPHLRRMFCLTARDKTLEQPFLLEELR